MDSLAPRHALLRRGARSARENDQRHHAPLVEIARCVGDAQVVTAQADRHRARPEFVVHLMEVPKELGIRPRLLRDHDCASSSRAESGTLKSYSRAKREAAWTPTAYSTTVSSAVHVVRWSSTTSSPTGS